MASIQYFSNLNLNKNQILNAVIHNTDVESVNPEEGQLIFDTENLFLKYYDGENWQTISGIMPNKLIYKGSLRHDVNQSPVSPETGDLYIFISSGIAVNFNNLEVQSGDFIFYNSESDSWISIQGNVIPATTSNPGIVELASNQEVLDGTDSQRAVVSKYLSNWENQTDKALKRKRVFENQIINSNGLILYHHIGKDNVIVDVYDGNGQKIYLDIEKDINMIKLRSNIEIFNVKVVISA